jgi:hypothetical protein
MAEDKAQMGAPRGFGCNSGNAAGSFAALVTIWPKRVDQINPDEQHYVGEAVGKLSFTPKVCPKPAQKKLESTTNSQWVVNSGGEKNGLVGQRIISRKYGKQEKSLNNAILAGPELKNSILRMLLLFRLNPFAISADVSKMFLSVGMVEQDRKWYKIHIDGNDYQFNNWPFENAAGPFAAKFGQLNADEIGPNTRGRKLLEAYEADEIERQVQQEAIQSAALAQFREEEKLSDSD